MSTRLRSMRIADEIWGPAAEVAAERGETLSDVVRRALVEYGERGKSKRKTTSKRGNES